MKRGRSGARRGFDADGDGWDGDEAPRNRRGGVSTSARPQQGWGAAAAQKHGGAVGRRREETREERIFRRAEAMDDGDDSEEDEGEEDGELGSGEEEAGHDDGSDGAQWRLPSRLLLPSRPLGPRALARGRICGRL